METRTPNLVVNSDLLYQLSYRGYVIKVHCYFTKKQSLFYNKRAIYYNSLMLFEALRKPDPIVSWVAQSSPTLTAALLGHLQVLRSQEPDNPRLDPNTRLLSEMGLCGAIHRVNLPAGYHPVHGRIYFGGSDTVFTEHEFAMFGDNIICITPGQFIEDGGFKKGERITRLATMDSRRIIVDGELAVLFGKKSQIEKSYGMRYATQ